MLYIQNKSGKAIFLGSSVMLLPDQRIENDIPEEKQIADHLGAARYSDVDVVKAFLRLGILEMVDVVTVPKAENPGPVRTIYEESDEEVESEGEKETIGAPEKEEIPEPVEKVNKPGRKSSKKST